MTPLNISEIQTKISELRAVFVLGQRAVPFLEEIFYFLKEIVPMMEEINASIQDSTSKMPRATSQLQSVSQATELATTEILDLVDKVFLKLDEVQIQFKKGPEAVEALQGLDQQVRGLLQQALGDADPAVLAQFDHLFEQKAKIYRRALKEMDVKPAHDEIRNHMNRIMMSLQVQDITSQQIAAVNHMIESIRHRMAHLIERITSGDFDAAASKTAPVDDGTFDPNAQYDPSGRRQAFADDVMGALDSGDGIPTPEPSSQDDIDALFAAPAASGTPTSQDDIDALFGDGSAQEPASQDDIDRLFQ